jgi:peptidoglycan-associated lipoprotein
MKKLSILTVMLLGTSVAYAQTTPTQEDIKAYINSQITDAVTQLNGKFADHATTDTNLQTQINTLEAQVAELSMLVEAANLEDITAHFDFDSYELTAEEASKLSGLVDFMKKYPNKGIMLEGHTDERGTREYNLALGERRANAVKEHLINNGIAGSRVTTVSYGKERPMCLGSNSSCWNMNRRVHVYVN